MAQPSSRPTVRSIQTRLVALAVVALAVVAVGFSAPVLAQSCPAGQAPICFPDEVHFEYWRYTVNAVRFARELVWFSTSRQRLRDQIPFGAGVLDQYFDFEAQTLTVVQANPDGTFGQCNQFADTESYETVCFGCMQPTGEDPTIGGIFPLEQWYIVDGSIVRRDVTAYRVGETLIPLRLVDRQSTTFLSEFMNLRTEVDDADFELPCTPIVITRAQGTDLLRDLERAEGLPPGTLGRSLAHALSGSEVGQ